jgi:hypothetical protein
MVLDSLIINRKHTTNYKVSRTCYIVILGFVLKMIIIQHISLSPLGNVLRDEKD